MEIGKRKIAVVGSGAVGGYYGGLLARNGYDVHFLVRTGFEKVKEEGFEIRYEADSFYVNPIQVYRNTGEIGPCDIVIIALKTTVNDLLPKLLEPLMHEQTVVLTLQNGMGNVERLAEFVPAENILGGLCFVCINRISATVIENYRPGQLYIGEYVESNQERVADIVQMFEHSGVDCHIAGSLAAAHWKKLCWNIPFNGLSILGGGITTDGILASEPLKKLARCLMEELQQAAQACDVEINERFLDKQFEITHAMDAYKPSSLIDYLEGRDVEVESIFGEPLRRGEAKGIAMPYLRSLYYALQHLVEARGNEL